MTYREYGDRLAAKATDLKRQHMNIVQQGFKSQEAEAWEKFCYAFNQFTVFSATIACTGKDLDSQMVQMARPLTIRYQKTSNGWPFCFFLSFAFRFQ